MFIKITPFVIGFLWSMGLSAEHVNQNTGSQGIVRATFFVPGKGAKAAGVKQSKFDGLLTNSIGMEFMKVPAGEFLMGSKDGDADEIPQRRERISEPFYAGRYEVTQQQWFRVMGTKPWEARERVQIGNDRPAVYLNWLEAQEFVNRLNKLEGCHCYRLPTEAQWEYAARAGTSTEYSHGNDSRSLDRYAWYSNNTANQSAHSVGKKQPNPWGLYDIHGNVWEWVADWDKADLGPRIRGGSWGSPASSLRSANRSAAQVGRQASHIGFRVIRILDGT